MVQVQEEIEQQKMPEKTKKEGRRQLNINLSEDEFKELERRATETGKTYRELICEDMELGRRIEPSSSHGVKKGLVGLKNEDISQNIKDALKKNNKFWGFNLVKAAKDIGAFSNWDDLSDDDRAYLLAPLYRCYRDEDDRTEKIAKDLVGIAKALDTDEQTVRAFFKRIVLTGENSYDLRAD